MISKKRLLLERFISIVGFLSLALILGIGIYKIIDIIPTVYYQPIAIYPPNEKFTSILEERIAAEGKSETSSFFESDDLRAVRVSPEDSIFIEYKNLLFCVKNVFPGEVQFLLEDQITVFEGLTRGNCYYLKANKSLKFNFLFSGLYKGPSEMNLDQLLEYIDEGKWLVE